MDLTLPPEIETALTAAAKRNGVTPQQVVLECLRDKLLNGAAPTAGLPGSSTEKPSPESPRAAEGATQPETYPPGSLAEALKDYIGAISSKDRFPEGSRLSEDTGRKFAEGMVEKHRQGRL